MKKTKIVATIGPASDSEEVLTSMIESGMNVARLNFSHGSHEEHQARIDLIKKIRDKIKEPVAIMLDTKGPEIRIGKFKEGRIRIEQGQEFILTTKEILGDNKMVSVSYDGITDDVTIGGRLLMDDGLVEFEIIATRPGEVILKAINSGELSDRKGVNIPNAKIKLPALTNRDIEDIKFGIKNDVDFIAASFIRTREDVLSIRKILEENGGYNIGIISKIENREGVDNMDDILEVSDGIMVARGDLGVEIPPQEIPHVQKELIKKCNIQGKVVITATQMLDSMTRNPRPTRAEVMDVANSILDGTSAVMLSGESAAGKYPVNSIRMMRDIALATEASPEYLKKIREIDQSEKNTTNAIAEATWRVAKDLNAKSIITATNSGRTSRAISKYKPSQMIVAITESESVQRKLAMEWGVYPIVIKDTKDIDDLFNKGVELLKGKYLKEGDLVVLTAGLPFGKSGSTNMLKVEIIAQMLTNGMGIGSGRITGRAVVCENEEDLLKNFEDGDIIVTYGLDREMVKFVERASGIITEEGGLTSSGAIIGLSLKLPTIVGASGAIDAIKSGEMITMDVETGQVFRGIVENV
ncbi:MAG: pyruvate kinase [Ezakiella sp.]|nr:pyruvate kinase [Ezakiella sp.]